MNILHIGKFYPPHVGGMETFLCALANAQAQDGHHVTVLAHGDATLTATTHENDNTHNVHIERHNIQLYVGAYAPLALGLPLALIKHCFGKQRPHILHVHTPNVAALWAALLAPQPIVVHWHSDVILPPSTRVRRLLLKAWRLVETCILRRAARIIVTSQPYADSSHFLQPVRQKCRIVPLALPSSPAKQNVKHMAVEFLRDTATQGEMALLAVGRLAHYKGFSILLEAMQKVRHMRLCLVGQGELHEALAQDIIGYGLQERVLLAGEVDDAVLCACYDACHAFVLPSIARTEAFGLVLLEAMRAGKPCIATRVPGSGMNTVVQHGVTGLVVPPHDSDALAHALEFLQNNEAQRQHMGQQGRLRWEKEYTLDSVVTAIHAVYAEIIRGCS